MRQECFFFLADGGWFGMGYVDNESREVAFGYSVSYSIAMALYELYLL